MPIGFNPEDPILRAQRNLADVISRLYCTTESASLLVPEAVAAIEALIDAKVRDKMESHNFTFHS